MSHSELRVIAYTGGHNAPSRVPRVQLYVPQLESFGIELNESASHAGLYPPDQKWKRPVWGLWNLLEHSVSVPQSYKYDVTLLQREMLSTFLTLEPLTKRPRILDVDDAIWVHRGGEFARRLTRLCDHVICGNQFLAEEFSRFNPNVSVLPSSVDTREFFPSTDKKNDGRLVIGWMGLHSGFRFLDEIKAALQRILNMHPHAILQIISDKRPNFHGFPARQVEFVPWSRES